MSTYLRSNDDDLRQLNGVRSHRVEDVLQLVDDGDQALHGRDGGEVGAVNG